MAMPGKYETKAQVSGAGVYNDLSTLAQHLAHLMDRSGLTQEQLVDLIDADQGWDSRDTKPTKSAMQSAVSKVQNARGRIDVFFLEMIARNLEYWYYPERNPQYDPLNPCKTPNMHELARRLEERIKQKVTLPDLSPGEVDALFILAGYTPPRLFVETLHRTTDSLPAIEEMSPLIEEFRLFNHDLHHERIRRSSKRRRALKTAHCV